MDGICLLVRDLNAEFLCPSQNPIVLFANLDKPPQSPSQPQQCPSCLTQDHSRSVMKAKAMYKGQRWEPVRI